MLLTLLVSRTAKPPVIVPPKQESGFVGGVSRLVTSADIKIIARKMRKKRDEDDLLAIILS